ncbi:ferritin 1 heavy chain [Augochlora pura]
MKLFYVLLASFLFIAVSSEQILTCTHDSPDLKQQWVTLNKECTGALNDQFYKEIEAARTYLIMGARFSEYTYNRPGFSEFFFKAANEEREHGIKILEYMSMRGIVISNDIFLSMKNLTLNTSVPGKTGLEALETALDKEVAITKNIRDLIEKCEKDYHLADYLTTDFLDEQYKGQRDLAGKIKTLSKMNNNLGEFLFDKKLLKGEV